MTKSMHEKPLNLKLVSRVYKYLPIIIVLFYLFFSIFVFAFGPNKWPIQNPVKLYSFLFFANLSLLLGYVIGINRKTINRVNIDGKRNLLYVSLIIFSLLLPLTSFARTGNFLPDLKNASMDLGQAYYESRNLRTAWPEYIRILVSPLLVACFPLFVYYWSNIRKPMKFIFILAFCYFISIDISRGTSKSLADYLIMIVMLLVLMTLRGYIEKNKSYRFIINGNTMKKVIITSLISIALLYGFITFFSQATVKRTYTLYNSHTNTYIDMNNFMLATFSDEVGKYGVAKLMDYVSQGYYGLSLALDKPFKWSYGLGYSSFLLEHIDIIKDKTYAYRLYDDGWPTGLVWSSFYVWPASDITFYFVFVLMILIGYLYAKSWLESLLTNNYISVIVFTLLSVLCFYLPSNNQIFQSGEAFVSSWFWILIWIFRSKKQNSKYLQDRESLL